MNTIRPVRTALCAYDALRLGFILAAFLRLQPEGEIPFPWLALITPGAMFFLISLFWQINIARYHLFSPLYLAGKGFAIVTTALWLFFAKNDMIREMFINQTARSMAPGMVLFLLLGDLISVWIVVMLFHGRE